jgi:hypothetical protein
MLIKPKVLADVIAGIYGVTIPRSITAMVPVPCHCRGQRLFSVCQDCQGSATVCMVAPKLGAIRMEPAR